MNLAYERIATTILKHEMKRKTDKIIEMSKSKPCKLCRNFHERGEKCV